MKILDVRTPPLREDVTPGTQIDVFREPQEYVARDGEVSDRLPAVKRRLIFSLVWGRASWRISELKLAELS